MIDPIVDLAPGADENALAVLLADIIRSNVRAYPRKAKSLFAMRATVHVVAFDSAETVSLRFDHGRLTLHEGNIGVPAVTLCGEREALLCLTTLPVSKRLGIPWPRVTEARDVAAVRALYRLLSTERLVVYGLLSHPRLVSRVLRVLSNRG